MLKLSVYGLHREVPEADPFNTNTAVDYACGLPVKNAYVRTVIRPKLDSFDIDWRKCAQTQQNIFAGAIATDDVLEFEQAKTDQSVCIRSRSDFIVDTLDQIARRMPGEDCTVGKISRNRNRHFGGKS